MSTPVAYPVTVEGELDPELSRWLWLVKLFLVIPHIIILPFLWLALIILTVAAFFGILFTGRYPRGIFDFNVGVLRWTWRVGFYFLNAFGTDRYPPFSLKSADYPATLEVQYAEQLSRSLMPFKPLLAIPHYVILSFFRGRFGLNYMGLNLIVVLFGGVALLFSGRYPRDLFEFAVGMNRWSFRVAAYALLMRDEYPPFRFSP